MSGNKETLFSTINSLVGTSATPAEEAVIVAKTAAQICSESAHTNLGKVLRTERVDLERGTFDQLGIFVSDIMSAARERINLRRKQ